MLSDTAGSDFRPSVPVTPLRTRQERHHRPRTADEFMCLGAVPTAYSMPETIEISDDLKERLDAHREEGETYAEFIEELVSVYETEGSFLQEGYSD
jgi:hypothetical protein